jgi:FlaA1/EpsC-like NDP-sugar epimerase
VILCQESEFHIPVNNEIWLWIVAPIVAIPVFIRFGLFRAVIEYVEFQALSIIVKAVTLYALILSMGILVSGIAVPRSVVPIHWFVTVFLIASSRVVGRSLFSRGSQGVFASKPDNSSMY